MARYRTTHDAAADLLEIGRYTQKTWGRAQREKYMARLQGAFERLAENPELGRTRPEVSVGLRSFPVERHVIYFQTAAEGILVVRVLHMAMDHGAQLQGKA